MCVSGRRKVHEKSHIICIASDQGCDSLAIMQGPVRESLLVLEVVPSLGVKR